MDPELLDWSDIPAYRNAIFQRAADAAGRFRVQNKRGVLALKDVHYKGPERYSLAEQKRAILDGTSLTRRLRGTWQLFTPEGQLLGSKTTTLMHVPYLTERGSFIRNGTEYYPVKQLRLDSAPYTRRSEDGSVETQFNVVPRTGTNFRINFEPERAEFYMHAKGRKVPLYPVLNALGVQDKDLRKEWGAEIFERNKRLAHSPYAVNWLRQFQREDVAAPSALEQFEEAKANELSARPDFSGEQKEASDLDLASIRRNLGEHFGKMRLNAENAAMTLGEPTDVVTPRSMLLATRRMLKVQRGEDDPDDRDSLAFQRVHDYSDYIDEAVTNDLNKHGNQLLWRLMGKSRDANSIPPGLLDKHVDDLFNSSLLQAGEEINPLDMHDQNMRVTRLGPGAIPSLDSAPMEARQVQPSYLGFIDSVRSPESLSVGLDLRFVRDIRKGKDNRLYARMLDRKGNLKWVDSRTASLSTVAFPDALKSKDRFVPAIDGKGRTGYVDRKDVDYIIPDGSRMFSDNANLVPLIGGIKGMRLLMAGKHFSQALPLVAREAPLVRTLDPESGKDNETRLGKYAGALRAKANGVVKQVRKDGIIVSYEDGTEEKHEIYDNFPLMRKTFVRNIPRVKAGQKVVAGTLLASSNFTDDQGTLALGRNMRIAYMPYLGENYEDAVVLSESAAKKFTSEHSYRERVDKQDNIDYSKPRFQKMFPAKFSRAQLERIDANGRVLPGTVLHKGDPIFIGVKTLEPGPDTAGRRINTAAVHTWDHEYPGVVVDVGEGKEGLQAMVRSNQMMQISDKCAGSFGNKGTVSRIIPDDRMPRDAKGRPFDMVWNSDGVISRTNTSQLVEALLGKVADKTGVPETMPQFLDEDVTDYVARKLAAAKLSDTETVFDPVTNKHIPQVMTGVAYTKKLHHTADYGGKARSQGSGYSAEGLPTKGGDNSAKTFGKMELEALLGHGAQEILRETKLIKGQANASFWRDVKLGKTPVMPKTPFVYEKFQNLLKAAGINVRRERGAEHIFAMTGKQVDELTGHKFISNSDTFNASTMHPIKGGLFDPELMGADGNKWAAIKLPEPVLNPIMEAPVRAILGLKQKELKALLDGETVVNGKRGGYALQDLLARVDVNKAIGAAEEEVRSATRTKRDAAIKRFTYLQALKKQGLQPSDFLWTRVPVLPPKYRPISKVNDLTMVADANYLYKALLDTTGDYNDAVAAGLPDEEINDSRSAINNAVKALVGTADPDQPKLVEQRVEGILSAITGKGSPKYGFIQRRVIGTNIDMTGLAVISPNPSLKLNQVGLPEKQAWTLYEPFIVRELVRRGYSATEAAKQLADHSKTAYDALQKVVQERPVMYNRAPTLHKYSIMAAWPVLTKGSSLQIHPAVTGPFGADFDGDKMSFTVPVTDAGVKEAIEKMMPERNLLSERNWSAHYAPSNEYVKGLYLATKPPKRRAVKVFNSVQEAKDAYRRGDIDIDDPIQIRDNTHNK